MSNSANTHQLLLDRDPDRDQTLDRISVRPPYYDLADVTEVGDGMVTAQVPMAPPPTPETGTVEAAQAARHLAILGSYAAALKRGDDARHHYLATRAHFSRVSSAPAVADEPLRADAVGSWIDRRTARAMAKLSTAEGRALHLLDVKYTVLTPKMFDRLNPPLNDHELMAAAKATEVGFDLASSPAGVTVDCGPIPLSVCAGHFPDYPAAPVAIVMGHLCRAAADAMAIHLDRRGHLYRIEEAHVVATRLGRAGQRLSLEASYQRPIGDSHELKGRALADGDTIGEVTVIMSSHPPA